MRALLKKSPEHGVWMEDVPTPHIGVNDVPIKISKTSICGTDVHIFNWDAWAQKTVPVFSAENDGLRLGVAQVAGSASQVAKVKGVAELRLNFRNVGRVYVYIPVSSISTKLERVQGVSVWALAGLKVLSF